MDSAQDTLAGGFPHSDIFGSKLVRNSPKLFAAYHVLHRLSAPRHPPNALKTLDHSHCRYPPRAMRATISTGEKTSFFEICPIAGGLRLRVRATDPVLGPRTNLLFTMSENARRQWPAPNQSFPRTRTDAVCRLERPARPPRSKTRGKDKPSITRMAKPNTAWWSQTGSNRRPPACKAGALPTELWPRRRTEMDDGWLPSIRHLSSVV